MRLLAAKGLPTRGYRSKSWHEFAAPGAPEMDLVITVCAAAAGEVCPVWPGAPLNCHWGVDDPASAPPDQMGAAFQVAYHSLSARINAFLALPFETLDGDSLQARGRSSCATGSAVKPDTALVREACLAASVDGGEILGANFARHGQIYRQSDCTGDWRS